MSSKKTKDIFASLTGFTILLVIVFGILHFFGITPIDLKNWVIGIGCFWWLIIITTVPWNTHFEAK